MSEHRMPELPEGYRWTVGRGGGGYGVVRLQEANEWIDWSLVSLKYFKRSARPEVNAKRAVRAAEALKSKFINPPKPPVLDVSGLTGAVLGEGVVGSG